MHLLTPSMRLCRLGLYSCVPGGKLGIFKGQTISASISAEVRAFSTLRPMGWLGGRVMPPFPFSLERYRSLVVGPNSCRAGCAGLLVQHEFSDSNSWTASTDVPPEELRWPPCTYWKLGWCRMLRVPVLVQRCGCLVVVNWYGVLCHTQYVHNVAWGKQWSGTTSIVCLCPLPTSSVQPLGWDWEPPCTESLVHWCASWRRGAIMLRYHMHHCTNIQ